MSERPFTSDAQRGSTSAPVSAWSERRTDVGKLPDSFDALLRASDTRAGGVPSGEGRERGWSSASSDGDDDDGGDGNALFINHRRAPDEAEISVGAHVGNGVDFVVGTGARSQQQLAQRMAIQRQTVLSSVDDPTPWTTVGYVNQDVHDLGLDWETVPQASDLPRKLAAARYAPYWRVHVCTYCKCVGRCVRAVYTERVMRAFPVCCGDFGVWRCLAAIGNLAAPVVAALVAVQLTEQREHPV